MKEITHHILVVEDDADMRELMGVVIQGMGLRAALARDADEALEVFSKNPDISLVLLDLGLSGTCVEDFVEGARCLRTSQSVKLILASGRDNLADEARRLQADAILAKPFDLSKLESTILKTLESR